MRSPLSSTELDSPWGAATWAAGPGQGDPAQLAREILEDGAYQKNLPRGGPQPFPEIPFLADIMTVLFWVGLAVLVVMLVVWLVRWIRAPRALGDDPELEPGQAQVRAHAGPSLADAEEMARAGRFGEATHLLLLAAIAHLGSGLDQPPQPSDTSREILRALPLRGSAKENLRHLVGRVEVFLFGGRDLIENEYLDCRARCETLLGEEAA